MKKQCEYGVLFITVNTIILGIIASLLHNAYPFSGDATIVGLFTPVNESVWEHLKFMFFPNLAWWIITYFLQKSKCEIDIKKWIISTAVSVGTAVLMVIFLYYSYTGAFGTEILIVDIAIVFISYFIALWLAFHYYKFVKPSVFKVIFSITLIVVMAIAFIVFTFLPPELPIFYDTSTGTYGI